MTFNQDQDLSKLARSPIDKIKTKAELRLEKEKSKAAEKSRKPDFIRGEEQSFLNCPV